MAQGVGSRGTSDERRQLGLLVLGAGVTAALVLGGLVFAAGHGLLPPRLLRAVGNSPPPATTNPETTALGSVPIDRSQCGFTSQSPGAVCIFSLRDQAGNLLSANLTVSVPAAWLRRQARPTAMDNMDVIRNLMRTGYAPPGGGLDALAVSVDPSYGARLRRAGIAPAAFLAWLYRYVAPVTRPPWVPGSLNPDRG